MLPASFSRGSESRRAGTSNMQLLTLLETSWHIRQLPGQGEHIARGGLENVRIDGVDGIRRLVKVRMHAAAHDGDCRYAGLFEGHMIATGEKAEEIQLVPQPCRVSCAQSDVL